MERRDPLQPMAIVVPLLLGMLWLSALGVIGWSVLALLRIPVEHHDLAMREPAWQAVGFVVGCTFTLLMGWVAGRIAGAREVAHGLALGLAWLVLGGVLVLPTLVYEPAEVLTPAGIASFVLTVPLAVAGALWVRRRRRRRVRRALLPLPRRTRYVVFVATGLMVALLLGGLATQAAQLATDALMADRPLTDAQVLLNTVLVPVGRYWIGIVAAAVILALLAAMFVGSGPPKRAEA